MPQDTELKSLTMTFADGIRDAGFKAEEVLEEGCNAIPTNVNGKPFLKHTIKVNIDK
jgi:hypothetical protein